VNDSRRTRAVHPMNFPVNHGSVRKGEGGQKYCTCFTGKLYSTIQYSWYLYPANLSGAT
jgi:hypothetical protein